MERLLLLYILRHAQEIANFLKEEETNYPDTLSALQDFMQEKDDNGELDLHSKPAIDHLTQLILSNPE